MFACRVCVPADPAPDTVRFDMAALAKAQADEAAKEEQRRADAQEAERAEEQRRADEEARARRRAEAERLRGEEERTQREAEQRAAAEAVRVAEEAEQREASERAAAAAHRRKTEVAAFLQKNGFTNGVAGPKKCMTKTKYPLHTAAKRGGAFMVEMLLQEGADATQKDSTGRTAAQVAQKENRNNSHAQVLQALAAVAPAGRRAAGGA